MREKGCSQLFIIDYVLVTRVDNWKKDVRIKNGLEVRHEKKKKGEYGRKKG